MGCYSSVASRSSTRRPSTATSRATTPCSSRIPTGSSSGSFTSRITWTTARECSPVGEPRRRIRSGLSSAESDPLVVLLEACLRHYASRHRVLTERGGHAAYLVVSLLGPPGPVVAVPALRLHPLGVLVPVQLEIYPW